MSENKPVYAIASYQIEDFDTFFAGYAQPVHGAMSDVGAEILSASPEVDVREGAHPNNWSILLKFPSADVFDAFYKSPAYQALFKVRENVTQAGKSIFYVLPTFTPPAPAE